MLRWMSGRFQISLKAFSRASFHKKHIHQVAPIVVDGYDQLMQIGYGPLALSILASLDKVCPYIFANKVRVCALNNAGNDCSLGQDPYAHRTGTCNSVNRLQAMMQTTQRLPLRLSTMMPPQLPPLLLQMTTLPQRKKRGSPLQAQMTMPQTRRIL